MRPGACPGLAPIPRGGLRDAAPRSRATPIDPHALADLVRRLATPVDARALISAGVLRPRGRWYEVPDVARLPRAARIQITAMRAGAGGLLVRVWRRHRAAEVLAAEPRAHVDA